MLQVINAHIVTPTADIAQGSLTAVSGKITGIVPSPAPPRAEAIVIDARDHFLVPGFLDLQVNGGFGFNFTRHPETMWDVGRRLPQYGVTSFLPTIVTSPLAVSSSAIEIWQAGPPSDYAGAAACGLHLEGPFLNPAKKGAHDPDHIRLPSQKAAAGWSKEKGVRLVTLAPEQPGATAVIADLVSRGVIVSAGHSMATFAQAVAGFAAGIRYGTHLFNAMTGIHHREPGLAGALLSDERPVIGLIPDGIHVHPALVKAVWDGAGARLNLVSDAMGAMGMPPGTYELGQFRVTVDENSSRLADGTLAGSILPLDAGLRNLMQFSGCTLAEALATITTIPAQLLGLETEKGHLAPGWDADFVLLDHDYHVVKTFVGGRLVFDATASQSIEDETL